MEQKNTFSSYIQNISLFLLGILFITFPVMFATPTTSPLILPKQVLLAIVILLLLVLQGLKMLADNLVKIRKTPFDIPILLMGLIALLSAIFAVNRADSLTNFVTYLLGILTFFVIVNIVKEKNSLLFSMFALLVGAILLSISSILSFFKIYLLPFPQTHSQTFSFLGSDLEQIIYLIIVFSVSLYYLWRLFKAKNTKHETSSYYSQSLSQKTALTQDEITKASFFGITSLVILLGIIVTAYSLIKIDKPPILPMEIGFQTAFSQISLDTGRVAQGFLLGSGIGTYSVDFTRWKHPSFNQNEELWNVIFLRSSSFALELLATTGALGFSAFFFLFFKAIKELVSSLQNKIFLALLVSFIISFLLPFSFTAQTLFFIILGLFAANQGLTNKNYSRFFDVELQMAAFKKGLIGLETTHTRKDKGLIFPIIVFVLILIAAGVIGYLGTTYAFSDIIFQKSLDYAAKNNGSKMYEEQTKAISAFKYRDGFYRAYSQTNLTLANALASQQPKDAPPNPKTQETITNLIQQAINSARSATTIAPQTYINWQNLSSVYRALIGFGQNAETFAIATAQQSVRLDPNNPAQYISLGGIYYQLGQWENAQNQFQLAVNLKPNYANAHYNLGHALEQKGDLQNALAQYQIVKNLVVNDKVSLDKVNQEIEVLQSKVAQQTNPSTNTDQTLNINLPEKQLPPREPQVKIPAPPVATESSR